jgi:hypothetical protein
VTQLTNPFLQPTTIFELFELFAKGNMPYDEIVRFNTYLGLFLILSFQAPPLTPLSLFHTFSHEETTQLPKLIGQLVW